MALVFLGPTGGNRILAINSSLFDRFKIYRKTNGDFAPAETIKKDAQASDIAPKGDYPWVDEGFGSFAVYKVVGVGKDGKEYELPTIVSTPRRQSK